ncbi:adhesion G protein-coupled receptor L3-like [Lytechinus variegatus]|uniref:adhesion G protein-coupled receptor L3-like n=1 Tax=Lytechinus variegatus TaxID=7654 RepID=UPI001BB0EC1F|nr:adhesion G protein-coupled receptor L3-like [Lytechinus variegatus]
MVSTNRTHTTCECVHFTHFAILMEPPPPPPPDIVDMVFVWSARALAGVSETLLFLLICVFVCCTRVRSLRHLIHAHVALSCMLSIQFLCLATLEWTPLICLVMGALFEYFCLAFAFWLLIESIQGLSDVHFGYRQADRIITSCPVPERYYGYMCLAWGAPGLVVGVTIAININAFQELNSGLCWVTDEHDLYLSFYGPLGVCFGLTMLFMFIVRRGVDKFFNTETLSSSMLATCVISIVNVGAWAAGYLGFYGPTIVAYYIYLLTYASMLKLIFGKNLNMLKGHRKIRGIGNGRNTPVEKITITQDNDNTGKKRKKKKKGKKPVTYVPGGKDHWSRDSSKLPGRTNASVRIQPRADNEKKIILS